MTDLVLLVLKPRKRGAFFVSQTYSSLSYIYRLTCMVQLNLACNFKMYDYGLKVFKGKGKPPLG